MDDGVEEYDKGKPYKESSMEDWDYKSNYTYKIVDIRCNVGPKELLMRYRMVDAPIRIDEWNLMLLMCSWCSRQEKKKDPMVRRVIHKYNLLAELVESEIERM